jgi:hydrogenase nickel incorporation protein HypA/HybF
MHELCIAQSIIDIAIKEMNKVYALSVCELELEVGALAGIEYSSLDFALEMLMKSEPFKTTKLVIHKPEGKALCSDCHAQFPTKSFITECPSCKSYRNTIIQGKELRVRSIIVE